MDYFGWIPNDIVNIILSFVDSIDDSLTLLLVCKRFHHLLRINEGRWRSLCLEFWRDFKQQLTQQGGWDYCIEGEYNLEWIQRESGKDWFWFSRCFANGIVFKGGYGAVWIGPTPGKTVNGWGIRVDFKLIDIGNFIEDILNGDGVRIWPNRKYVGQIVGDWYHGHGTLTYNSGVKYEGEWNRGRFHGMGSITYPDGIQYQGQWNMGKPGSMDCFYCDQ